MRKLHACIIIGAMIAITACASIKPSTVQAACTAIQASDAAFQQFALAHPGKVDANGMNTEGAAVVSVGLSVAGPDGKPIAPPQPGSICAPPYTITTAAAETTAITAALQIANLLASWQK